MKPAALALAASFAGAVAAAAPLPIDRRAPIHCHRPVVRSFDTESPLSVGNGELAFTADATGLQTFAEAYDETIPLPLERRPSQPLPARGRRGDAPLAGRAGSPRARDHPSVTGALGVLPGPGVDPATMRRTFDWIWLGNGGLLAAVGMMAAGWDGAPEGHAPGFPADGSWIVRWEGLGRIP